MYGGAQTGFRWVGRTVVGTRRPEVSAPPPPLVDGVRRAYGATRTRTATPAVAGAVAATRTRAKGSAP